MTSTTSTPAAQQDEAKHVSIPLEKLKAHNHAINDLVQYLRNLAFITDKLGDAALERYHNCDDVEDIIFSRRSLMEAALFKSLAHDLEALVLVADYPIDHLSRLNSAEIVKRELEGASHA